MAKNTRNFTEDEILDLYLEVVGNPLESVVDADEQLLLFTELAKIDGLNEWLITLMGEDMKTYFKATNDYQRGMVKGMYSRALLFKALLKKVRDVQEITARKAKRSEVVA